MLAAQLSHAPFPVPHKRLHHSRPSTEVESRSMWLTVNIHNVTKALAKPLGRLGRLGRLGQRPTTVLIQTPAFTSQGLPSMQIPWATAVGALCARLSLSLSLCVFISPLHSAAQWLGKETTPITNIVGRVMVHLCINVSMRCGRLPMASSPCHAMPCPLSHLRAWQCDFVFPLGP